MKPMQKPEKSASMEIKHFVAIFDFEMERRQIPGFRGAVVKKVGEENVLFHNHLGDQQFLYGYPLIQYKTIGRHPAIICINQGTEEVIKFFEQVNWDLTIYGKRIETEIRHISFDYFQCGLSPEPVRYKIWNWFALNEENYATFSALNSDAEKIERLRRILIGNMLSFAKGVQWNVDGEIKVEIPRLPRQRLVSFKRYRMTGFDLEFVSNMMLPNFIGLGKSTSRGFGLIRRVG
ncbi:CRISPR-associated endonuclease Cas6 [Desulfonema magnum]|uniref:CRISPR Cas6 domain-containing protein n=1 Tax=Desulfonema magnum TaxID=45655 RepID=A0A975GU58_9BACT|nr:CRISPR-associated endonuclease Cas6 [Desulfonema magnum]QTA93746.1 CRISPR Cas6 domain-containing protein [Desulfonema magnum]